MLRTNIYNEDKKVWLEEETLLMHDLCAIKLSKYGYKINKT